MVPVIPALKLLVTDIDRQNADIDSRDDIQETGQTIIADKIINDDEKE
jgi:hypothetical protein